MIGTTLGPYRIDRELGSGGMGRVYAATTIRAAGSLDPGSTVALKVVHAHLLETEGFFKRFLREAELGKRIVHENVVRTMDCDQLKVGNENYIFLTMEYVEGQTLRGLLRELERVPEDLCVHIGREIAKGLVAIHAAGVVHRDMKPENVLITKDHAVKVMDLGVARLQDELLRLSQTGAFVGSIHYAAPECFVEGGARVDGRADLYALGLILYELACGQNPYQADDIQQVLHKVVNEEPRRLGDVDPQLSPFFEEVVHGLMAKKAVDRFASADELLDVLAAGEDSPWWHDRARALEARTHRPIRRIRIPRETAVHGREEEFLTLRGLYERAKAGEGQVLLLEGEAGIGKSRLVDELIGRLQRDGEDLHFLFGSYPPSGAATASGAFSAAYRGQLGEAGAAPWLGQSPALVPAFDALLRGETTPPGCAPLTKDSLHTCFVRVTRNLAAERPTVVFIDDLHFAPSEGRALFTALAQAIPAHPVLLIGASRPGVDASWLVHLNRLGATRLALDRLGPQDLVRLLSDALRSKHLAEELAGRVAAKSDGNPFFVFEILRGLREGQFITQVGDGTWVTTGKIGDIQIARSVMELVSARVADLTEEERDVLDVAACRGYEFDPLLVGEVLGVAAIPVLKRFAQIERRHRLVRSAGLRYVFDHHQVQEALYASLPEPLRRAYHAELADVLERRSNAAQQDPLTAGGALCADLCDHFLRGGQGERALRYLPAAQVHLESAYVNEQAVALAERSLADEGLLVGRARAETLLGLAGVLDRLGHRERQEEVAREAVRLADAEDEEVQGRAAGALGILLLRLWRLEEAEAPLRRAYEAARDRGDRAALARAAEHLGSLAHFRGHPTDATQHYEEARALCQATGDRQARAHATGNLGVVALSQGRFAEARHHLESYLALSRELGDIDGEATAMGNLGTLGILQGRLADARGDFERSLVLSREVGDREGEALALGNLAILFQSQGRLGDARDEFVRALALSREIGSRQAELGVMVNLGFVWLSLGDHERARRVITDSLDLARELGAHHEEGYALEHLGVLADHEGNTEAAQRLLEESLRVRRACGHGVGITDVLLELADLLRRRGDTTGARAALDEVLVLSREHDRTAQVALAGVLGACLPGGTPADEGTLEGCEAPHHARRARWWLWIATGDRRHLAEAKRLLDEALALVPAEHRASMRGGSRLHREILAACREQGL